MFDENAVRIRACENLVVAEHRTAFPAGLRSRASILSAQHGSLSLATTVASGLTSGQISGNGIGTLSRTAPLAALNTTLAAS